MYRLDRVMLEPNELVRGSRNIMKLSILLSEIFHAWSSPRENVIPLVVQFPAQQVTEATLVHWSLWNASVLAFRKISLFELFVFCHLDDLCCVNECNDVSDPYINIYIYIYIHIPCT